MAFLGRGRQGDAGAKNIYTQDGKNADWTSSYPRARYRRARPGKRDSIVRMSDSKLRPLTEADAGLS
jgi:hypothetical protein